MRFTVPQFIDQELKILFFLTFKQIMYILMPGAVCFILYFSVPRILFFISTVILMTGGASFAFVKIGGRDLPSILANILKFNLFPKKYIWKKKGLFGQYPDEEEDEKIQEVIQTEEIRPFLKKGTGRLDDLSNSIETSK